MTATPRTLQAGKLEQACPCGRWEAAGAYCTGCSRPMTPAAWYSNGSAEGRTTARQDALENRRTPIKRGRGRPQVSVDSAIA